MYITLSFYSLFPTDTNIICQLLHCSFICMQECFLFIYILFNCTELCMYSAHLMLKKSFNIML